MKKILLSVAVIGFMQIGAKAQTFTFDATGQNSTTAIYKYDLVSNDGGTPDGCGGSFYTTNTVPLYTGFIVTGPTSIGSYPWSPTSPTPNEFLSVRVHDATCPSSFAVVGNSCVVPSSGTICNGHLVSLTWTVDMVTGDVTVYLTD